VKSLTRLLPICKMLVSLGGKNTRADSLAVQGTITCSNASETSDQERMAFRSANTARCIRLADVHPPGLWLRKALFWSRQRGPLYPPWNVGRKDYSPRIRLTVLPNYQLALSEAVLVECGKLPRASTSLCHAQLCKMMTRELGFVPVKSCPMSCAIQILPHALDQFCRFSLIGTTVVHLAEVVVGRILCLRTGGILR
jgi:hypothetical protein